MSKDGRFHRNGPANNPETAPKENKYPKPKKGQELNCMACNKGKISTGKKIRDCKACAGTGKIIV